MKATASLIALALASLCSTNVNALFIDEDVGGGGSGGGFGGVSNTVTIIGTRIVYTTIDYQGTTYLGNIPLARPPSGAAGPGVPPMGPPMDADEKQKRKDKCLADCSVQFQINTGICTAAVADLRASIAYRPYAGAILGGVAASIATRSALGSLAGAAAGWAYTTQVNATAIDDFKADCAATSALDYNGCVGGTCNAWFWLLAPTALRRRREEVEQS